jgi:hypothetical protein
MKIKYEKEGYRLLTECPFGEKGDDKDFLNIVKVGSAFCEKYCGNCIDHNIENKELICKRESK